MICVRLYKDEEGLFHRVCKKIGDCTGLTKLCQLNDWAEDYLLKGTFDTDDDEDTVTASEIQENIDESDNGSLKDQVDVHERITFSRTNSESSKKEVVVNSITLPQD